MIDEKAVEYHRLRSCAHLPEAGGVLDWDDNVSPTRVIREIYRRAEAGDKRAIKDRDWIAEQIKSDSPWHKSNMTFKVYRDWLAGKPWEPDLAHLYCPHCSAKHRMAEASFLKDWDGRCEEARQA